MEDTAQIHRAENGCIVSIGKKDYVAESIERLTQIINEQLGLCFIAPVPVPSPKPATIITDSHGHNPMTDKKAAWEAYEQMAGDDTPPDYSPLEEIRKAEKQLAENPNDYHDQHMAKVEEMRKEKKAPRFREGGSCVSGQPEDKAQERGLSQSRGGKDGEPPKAGAAADRARVSDTAGQSVHAPAKIRDNRGGPARGDEVLAANEVEVTKCAPGYAYGYKDSNDGLTVRPGANSSGPVL